MIQGRTEVCTGLCQAGIGGGSLEEAVVLGASAEGWGGASYADEGEVCQMEAAHYGPLTPSVTIFGDEAFNWSSR